MKAPNQKTRSQGKTLSHLCHAWTEMTREEQRAMIIILGLFLVGVATRAWHICF